jgi:hypothetical protein
MILTILFLVLLIICIVVLWCSQKYGHSEVVDFIGGFFGILSFIAVIFVLATILSVQIYKNIDYEQAQYERTQLIAEYEKGNEYAYDSIIGFDKQLLSIKKWANNPFTNWFYNQRIANEVDFILYEDYDFEIGGN